MTTIISMGQPFIKKKKRPFSIISSFHFPSSWHVGIYTPATWRACACGRWKHLETSRTTNPEQYSHTRYKQCLYTIFLTNSEHTLENAEKLSQFNECIYPFEPTGRGLSLDTREFCWTYCREPEKCHRMHNLMKFVGSCTHFFSKGKIVYP